MAPDLAMYEQSLTGLKSKEVGSPSYSALEKHGCDESGAGVFNVLLGDPGTYRKAGELVAPEHLGLGWSQEGSPDPGEKAGNRGIGAVGLRFGYEQR